MIASDLFYSSVQDLNEKGIVNAAWQVEKIFSYLLQNDDYSCCLTEEQSKKIQELIYRKGQKEPLEYLIEEISFYGVTLEVNRDVLIPRVETEIMVDLIAKDLKKMDLSDKTLFDICSGSGCIGISLKKAFPSLRVILSDVSDNALIIAEKNAKKNNVDVEIRKGDLFRPFEGQKADFIVSNPPYISKKEYLELDGSVKNFEPQIALCDEGDGYIFYRRFAAEIPRYLNFGGKAFFEIGCSQGEGLKNIFNTSSKLKGSVLKDLSRKDRFFFLEIQ